MASKNSTPPADDTARRNSENHAGEPAAPAPSEPASEGNSETGPGASASSATGAGHRFFDWMRGLGIVRQNGWVGGVCGGVAARLGIDPLIVRGIAVVIAVLGGPVFLLYAAAWLLLPDSSDGIHLERLIRGAFEPAIVGIGVLVLLTFLPFTQGVWWAGAQFWGEPYWPQSLGRALWSLVVIGVIVIFVIWAARRAAWSSRTRWSSEDRAGEPATPAPGVPASEANIRDDTASAPQAPPAPAEGASSEEFEAWKAQQQAWKEQHNAWRAQQDADARAIREQRSAEMRAQAQVLAAQADERRRIRRLANPRTSGAFVAITLGAALLGGGIAAIVALATPVSADYAVTIGFALATLVLGLSMVTAGAFRRRSGFLAFIAILVGITTVLTALPPRDRDFVLAHGSYEATGSARVFEPVGTYEIRLDAANLRAATASSSPAVIDVQQWAGRTRIVVLDGVSVRIVATRPDSGAWLYGLTIPASPDDDTTGQSGTVTGTADGGTRSVLSYGNAKQPDVIVRVSQDVGSVSAEYYENDTTSNSDQTGTEK